MKKEKTYLLLLKKILYLLFLLFIVFLCIIFQYKYMNDDDQARVTPLIIMIYSSFLFLSEILKIIYTIIIILKNTEKDYLFYSSQNVYLCPQNIYYIKNFQIKKIDYNKIARIKKIYYTIEWPSNLLCRFYYRIMYGLSIVEQNGHNHIIILYEIGFRDTEIDEHVCDKQVNYIIEKNNNIIIGQSEEIKCKGLTDYLIKHSK